MGIQKNTLPKKRMNYKQGLRNLLWTLKVAIDNSIDSKYLYDRSDKHLAICYIYNAECTARMIKNQAIEHIGHVQHNKYDEIQYLE